MKVNLVKWMNVLDVVERDREMRNAFLKFYGKLKESEWNIPGDILKTFNSADIVKCEPSNRIVFNVGGNKYRLICGYHFGKTYINLFLKFVGTHKQYDSIDACTVEMFKK